MSSISFEGRVVIVTGGAGRLGTAYAVELARRGAAVVVNDIGVAADGRSTAELLVEQIVRGGGQAAACRASVTDTDGPQAVLDLALERFGRIDAVVNNAGFAINKPFEEHSTDDFRTMQDVHLRGPYLLTQLAYRHMLASGYGRIVSMASSSGVFGLEYQVGYAMFKTAIVGFTNAVALEAAEHGVLVNAVLPRSPKEGRTKASRTRVRLADALHRLEPEFVAPLVVYLASEACTRTHRLYSAAAGCYAEVFTGLTSGWVAETAEPPTVDELSERFEEVESEQGYVVARSIPEEATAIVDRLRNRRWPERGDSRGAAGSGDVVIVTGAGHGLGRAYALQLATDGARVVVNDLAGADEVVEEISDAGGEALAVTASVTEVSGAEAIIGAAIDGFGRIDGLVNNAGIVVGGSFEVETEDELDRLLAVHTFGPFLCVRAALPQMKAQGYGRVVSVSSSAGVFGIATRPGYAATKAAMIGLTNVLAIEGASHGILANAVLPRARVGRPVPAQSRPELVPADVEARMRPEFVAPLISYLASSRCTTTHGVFCAAAGWYGRAFAGLAPGWASPGSEPPTAETLLDHLDELEAREGYTVPLSVDDETDAVRARLEASGILGNVQVAP